MILEKCPKCGGNLEVDINITHGAKSIKVKCTNCHLQFNSDNFLITDGQHKYKIHIRDTEELKNEQEAKYIYINI